MAGNSRMIIMDCPDARHEQLGEAISSDLLFDPLITIASAAGRVRSSLPEVLAALTRDAVEDFPALAAHQRQFWYSFLVQLGAMALARSGTASPPEDPASWRDLLNRLAPDHKATAWALIVEDVARPAFLQPPSPSGALDGFSQAASTPDGLDLLVTARNHDVKLARYNHGSAEHWMYALVCLQTGQGFLGAGNYGIARMNGGFASRVLVELSPSDRWGGRFRRGLAVGIDERRSMLEQEGYFRADGHPLLWIEPWDGRTSLSLYDLDPLFIEICRRVRLVVDPSGHIIAMKKPTHTARVQAKEAKGVVGDLWIPIDLTKGAALTIGKEGFTYRKVAEIIGDPNIELPAALAHRGDDPEEVDLHLAVLARGQGGTDGLHERHIPMRKNDARRLFGDSRPALGDIARRMVDEAAKGALDPLRLGLLQYLQGGREDFNDLRRSDRRPDPWLSRAGTDIDGIFFTHLWAIAAAGDVSAEDSSAAWRAWQQDLRARSAVVLEAAMRSLPVPDGRRERARAFAERAFRTVQSKALSHLRADPKEATP